MTYYISGPITNNPNAGEDFARIEETLRQAGFDSIINPEALLRPLALTEHSQYLHICKALVEVADAVLLLQGWRESTGACIEVGIALSKGIDIFELNENDRPIALDI